MGQHVTIYGIRVDDKLFDALLDYYDLDSEAMDYEEKYDKYSKDMLEYFGLHMTEGAENQPWGYMGVELQSVESFTPEGPMTYEELQNSIRPITKIEKEDFEKRLYHLRATFEEAKDTIPGYYKFWISE